MKLTKLYYVTCMTHSLLNSLGLYIYSLSFKSKHKENAVLIRKNITVILYLKSKQ